MNDGIDRVLEGYEDQYYAGNKWMLQEAVLLCVKAQRRAPNWVVEELETGLSKYRRFEVKTLDEAFGLNRKGVHLAQARKEDETAMGVYFKGEELRQEGRPVDVALFEALGEIFGLSAGVAKNYYYAAKDVIDNK